MRVKAIKNRRQYNPTLEKAFDLLKKHPSFSSMSESELRVLAIRAVAIHQAKNKSLEYVVKFLALLKDEMSKKEQPT